MFIEEIIIEGFKSYANRTVIGKFDSAFNAITGLNGSGKSNVLDSVCFVLGISNLSQVRVNALQELVYKHGQAGVTKASVTVVFNNEDHSVSPVGYEQYDKITVTRQVVIGGRNKYLINGHNAPGNRVQNLFHSVQLNVNNPHFLIMQGRITKVLNMKPIEILSMIEEAAGTRMYETKKLSALRTIEKKDRKVEEINKILGEEINPTLENLRSERTKYMKYTTNKAEIDRLSRFVVAFDFVKAEDTLHHSVGELGQLKARVSDMVRNAEVSESDLSAIKDRIKQMSKEREKEMEEEMRELEEATAAASQELVRVNVACKHKAETLAEERQQLASLEQLFKEVEDTISTKNTQLAEAEGFYARVQEQHSGFDQDLRQKQRQFETLSLGLSVEEGKGAQASVTDQILQAKQDIAAAITLRKELEMQYKSIEKEMKQGQEAMGRSKSEVDNLEKEKSRAAVESEKLRNQLQEFGFDESKLSELRVIRPRIVEEITVLRKRIDGLRAQLGSLQFNYSDPEAGFDRSHVKGLVAQLVHLKDQSAATALEVAAGGRLYHVVVEDELTGKKLIQKGKLKKRVTIIPLTKIENRTVNSKVLKSAEGLVGPQNVSLALSLVGYKPELHAAMNYVFGNTFVCKDISNAKQVCFDPQIRTRSVTLSGDLFDPAGTLTGGSAPSKQSLLLLLEEFSALQNVFQSKKEELSRVEAEIKSFENLKGKFEGIVKQFEIKKHELELLNQRVQNSSFFQVQKHVCELQEKLSSLNLGISSAEQRGIASEASLSSLEKSQAGGKEAQLKALESAISKAKKELSKETNKLNDARQTTEKLTLEIEELQREKNGLLESQKTAKRVIAGIQDEVERLEKEEDVARTFYDEKRADVEVKRKDMQAQSAVISELLVERDRIQKIVSDNEVEIKKLNHRLQRLEKGKEEAEAFVQGMRKKYNWISTDRQLFGQKNTDYDFAKQDIRQCKTRLNSLEHDQAQMAKTINKKVMGMFERVEHEYKELMSKKEIIEKDKQKIEGVIKELDQKKIEALNRTWTKVNKDFGSIFTTLLPGTQACLEPPEGKAIFDGLEVRVAFGDDWKESLVELSGGQRSLLALSLILALLLFKPAPMYILDEIDAALDPSHTQNIGQMLRKHFQHSQFIVVSLKKGMYQNASVLFKCKCVDGVSTVQRIARKEILDAEEAETSKKRQRRS